MSFLADIWHNAGSVLYDAVARRRGMHARQSWDLHFYLLEYHTIMVLPVYWL